MTQRNSRRFVLISPCGHGNLGDAAIQDVVISELRRRFADAQIVAATLNPRDTERRHGVAAVPLIALSRTGYNIILDGAPQRSPQDDTMAVRESPAPERTSLLTRAAAAIARALLPAGVPWLVRQELAHCAAAYRILRDAECLIVSGGGQLDEFWGGPWGHPYTLFKWALIARLRRAKVVVLSVGFGTLETKLGRRFARGALALARYRSYRDAGSLALMTAAGSHRADPVVPDLAYATPAPERSLRPTQRPLVVAINPIIYCDPRTWPRKDAAVYGGYLRRLADAVSWLVAEGHEVRIFTSDLPDERAVEDLCALCRTPATERAIRVIATPTVQGYIEAAADADVLVASRLHGVLLGHVAGTPTIAISYERKVAALMKSMEQSEYCLEIEEFEQSDFERVFEHLTSHLREAEQRIARDVRAFRRRLADQFETVLAPSA